MQTYFVCLPFDGGSYTYVCNADSEAVAVAAAKEKLKLYLAGPKAPSVLEGANNG